MGNQLQDTVGRKDLRKELFITLDIMLKTNFDGCFERVISCKTIGIRREIFRAISL